MSIRVTTSPRTSPTFFPFDPIMKSSVISFILISSFILLLCSAITTAISAPHSPPSISSIPDAEITDGFIFTKEEKLAIKHHSLIERSKVEEEFFCSSYNNRGCVACTSNRGITGGCFWCPTTQGCQGEVSLEECPEVAWLHDPGDCSILNNTASGNPDLNSNFTCSQPSDVGCGDNSAYNYKLRAEVDDGSCLYKTGHNATIPNCSDTCICESGGVGTPYGKYCGKGYTGCPTEQSCDQLDRCCQVHDWCVGQESYLSCDCNYQLLQCVEAIKPSDIANSFCPAHVEETLWTILTEVRSIILGDCFLSTPQPSCNDWINCYGRGTCDFDAGCTCESNYGGVFAYDVSNRTDCSCAPGYGPDCGPYACTIYGYFQNLPKE